MTRETDRFRPDNTEGYTLVELAELNRRYLERCESEAPAADSPEECAKSQFDRIAEKVLAEYDSELAAAAVSRA